MPVEIECEICGEEFSVRPYRKEEAKYCSKDCQFEGQKVEFCKLKCKECNDDFTVKPSRSESAKYCSRDCYEENLSRRKSGSNSPGWRGGKLKTKDCEVCDKSFEFYKSKDKYNANRFCSQDCRVVWWSSHISGQNHPHYNKDKELRVGSEYRAWRRKVINSANACNSCGDVPETYHAHHIKSVDGFPDLIHDSSNGEALCPECHADKHPDVPRNLILSKS